MFLGWQEVQDRQTARVLSDIWGKQGVRLAKQTKAPRQTVPVTVLHVSCPGVYWQACRRHEAEVQTEWTERAAFPLPEKIHR